MIFKNKNFRDIIYVTFSNGMSIISGILVGFIIPKIMGYDDYGYYKTFTLYCSYIGFASLGVIDGIVLKYGNKDLQELNKGKFRSYFKIYVIINSIVALAVLAFSVFRLTGEYKQLFILFGLDIVLVNVTGFFQQISQITQRFKEFSRRSIIKTVLNCAAVIVLYLLFTKSNEAVDYKLYIYFTLLINALLALWYVFTYRKLVFGESNSIQSTVPEIKNLIIIGFPLLFSNLCGTLILNLDRQFVSAFWPVNLSNTYSIYAFAYNMLSLITIATSAISTVLYPIMKRQTEEKLIKSFDSYSAVVLMFLFASMILYYPLCWFINAFIPKYIDSLIVFRVIFPGLSISTWITVIVHNYYKTLGKSHLYFIQSIIALGISFVFNTAAYLMFKSTIAISIVSIFAMLIWLLITQGYLSKYHSVKWQYNFLYMIIMMLMFYLISSIENAVVGIFTYAVVYAVFLYIFYRRKLIAIMKGEMF